MKKVVIGFVALALPLVAFAAPQLPQGVDIARTNNVKLFQVPPPGVDTLHFTVWDTIEIPGVGTDTVELRGTYTIRRLEANSSDWKTADLTIRMLNMELHGTSSVIGPISLRQNGNPIGYVRPTDSDRSPKFCVVSGMVELTLHDLGVTVFNKESVPLAHYITHIPPIGQGGSSPEQMRVPLYNVNDPDGAPVAYLLHVRTQIGGYVGGI